MNGISAALLIAATTLTSVGSFFSGKKRNILTIAGIGAAIAACAVAAKKDLEIKVDIKENDDEDVVDISDDAETDATVIETAEPAQA